MHPKTDTIKTFFFQWLLCCKQFHLQWNTEELEIILSVSFLRPYEENHYDQYKKTFSH